MRVVRPSTLGFYLTVATILGTGAGVIGARAFPSGGGAWFGLVPPAVIAVLGLRKPLRRWRLTQQTLPLSARRWLERHVPLYTRFDDDNRSIFEQNMQFFLDEYAFEGVQDVDVTDDLRWAVSAGGALLLHGRPDWELPGSKTILFYPGRFDDAYLSTDEADFEGMAHPQGPVIVSTRAVRAGWEDPNDGYNVVLHELAHLFDFENATADGVPSLLDAGSISAWQGLVRREMRRIERGDSILDSYGATHPAEFFAVAVENFFERPHLLRSRHRALYNALVAFFNFDPYIWLSSPPHTP